MVTVTVVTGAFVATKATVLAAAVVTAAVVTADVMSGPTVVT